MLEIPRLHPDTIEEVKQRVDIYDVISDYVVLKKRGKDYLGLCPFHDEKTPSFSVSPTKQLYYCLGVTREEMPLNSSWKWENNPLVKSFLI